jgi:hypothetical protein
MTKPLKTITLWQVWTDDDPPYSDTVVASKKEADQAAKEMLGTTHVVEHKIRMTKQAVANALTRIPMRK